MWASVQCKICIWYQEHLQSPTAHLSSTNSCSKWSISPLIRCVADLVSFLCFLLCILLQFLTILIKRASGLSLGTFYQNGALSHHFSHDFPCSPTLLLLFLPPHSLLFCLSLCRCLTGLNPYSLRDLWLQNGKTVLVIFSSFAPLFKKKIISLTVGGFHSCFRETNPCRDMASTCSWQVPQGRQGVGH